MSECDWDKEDAEHIKTVPPFIQILDAKAEKERKKQHFYLVFQDDTLKVTKVLSGDSYDKLWQQGTDEAKMNGGFWTIWNISGRFVDGNVIGR